MKTELREKALSFGAEICGFAGIERFAGAPDGFHPADLFPDCKSVIAFGIALPKGIFMAEAQLIYAYFNNFALPLVDRLAFQTAMFLEKTYQGIGVPLPCDVPYDYWDEEKMEGRGLLSMKHVAYLSGIGTLGKSTLLLNNEYGNRLVIGCVLTDLQIESDEMAAEVCLEQCDLCIKSCLAAAIGEGHVRQKLCRVNSFAKTKRGHDTVVCNQCRTVCPMGLGLA
ncbi:epoxyqueuosine reductase [Acetobacterium wieringae]|uniref:Epoxyqueuosine reductase n=1 Tax=Acetobacterium wieringae TaxID=52694 RepID=A0A5D0WI83_9FIRM|nr:epoxyqueuosine reductase [Acetobacterium wieringae]TYC83734.1 epoxyqueuosine reductase [Acetobacterium wieringae]